jgi:dGTPase
MTSKQSKMTWHKLLSNKRFGMEDYHKKHDDRTEFQRDFDRLIFSAPFRRLQNKTQVFPLPGKIFVHNRLTHSLEVSSVGRSLGLGVTRGLINKNGEKNYPDFFHELGSIVSAACLAHDLGNPPFGHPGEKAIATYFSEDAGLRLKDEMSKEEWNDIIKYEGNANAFRLLTHQFKGRRKGGFALTYSTLAAIAKYPYASIYTPENKHKFGFFQAEKDDFKKIADELGMIEIAPYQYARHPLVFLVEAADDICYEIMDIEDAFKLKILSYEETKKLFMAFISEDKIGRTNEILSKIDDKNEKITYLRSHIIGKLIEACVNVFVENEEKILQGKFESSLIKSLPKQLCEAYKACEKIAYARIYRSQAVVDIEVGGYNIIYTLIDKFTMAIMNPEKMYSKMLLPRVPEQYDFEAKTTYEKVLSVLDFVSGMTDVYALDLYQKITGQSLPQL